MVDKNIDNNAKHNCGPKFYIEVTGTEHASELTFLFCDSTNDHEQSALEQKKSHSRSNHGSLVYSWDWTKETQKLNVGLGIKQSTGKVPIRVPLFTDVTAYKPKIKGSQNYLIQSVIPLTLLPTLHEDLPDNDRLAPLRDGYIYITYNNKFWREIKVSTQEDGSPCFQDVHLHNYRGAGPDAEFKTGEAKDREVTGAALEEVWFPAKENGEQTNVRFAFSEVQWSNERLNFLEHQDNRDELNQRMEVVKAEQIDDLPEMRPREPEYELNMADPRLLNHDLTGKSYQDCYEKNKNKLHQYWHSEDHDWNTKSIISYKSDCLENNQKDNALIKSKGTYDGTFYYYKFDASECDFFAQCYVMNEFIIAEEENENSIPDRNLPPEYKYKKTKHEIKADTQENKKCDTSTYISSKETPKIWKTQSKTDYLNNVKQRNNRYIKLKDPIFILYYYLNLLHDGIEYNQKIETLASYNKYYPCAQLVHNFLLPSISKKLNKSIDLTNNGTFSTSLKIILKNEVNLHIQKIKKLMLNFLNGHELLLSIHDITSRGDSDVPCAYQLINESFKLLCTNQDIVNIIQSKYELSNNLDYIKKIKTVINKLSLYKLNSDNNITPTSQQKNDEIVNDGSGIINSIYLKNIIQDNKLSDISKVTSLQGFNCVRVIANAPNDFFCGYYMALRTVRTFDVFKETMGKIPQHKIRVSRSKTCSKSYEKIIEQSAIIDDELKELTLISKITISEGGEYIYIPGLSNKYAKLIQQGKKIDGVKDNGCILVKNENISKYDGLVGFKAKGNITTIDKLNKYSHDADTLTAYKKLSTQDISKNLKKAAIFHGILLVIEINNCINAYENGTGDWSNNAKECMLSAVLDLSVVTSKIGFSLSGKGIPVVIKGIENLASLITTKLLLSDAYKLAKSHDTDAAIFSCIAAFATSYPIIFGFFGIPLGILGSSIGSIPISLIILLSSLICVGIFTDDDMENWIKHGPFGKYPEENGNNALLNQDPEIAYKQLLNMLIKMRIETGSIDTLRHRLSEEIIKSNSILKLINQLNDAVDQINSYNYITPEFIKDKIKKDTVSIKKSINMARDSGFLTEQSMSNIIDIIEEKNIIKLLLKNAAKKKLIAHNHKSSLVQTFRNAISAHKTLAQINENLKKNNTTHYAYIKTNIPYLLHTELNELNIKVLCREVIESARNIPDEQANVYLNKKENLKFNHASQKEKDQCDRDYELSLNWKENKKLTAKHGRIITPQNPINTDEGILYLFYSKPKSLPKTNILNMTYHRVNIQMLCHICYDRFIFPQPPLDKYQEMQNHLKERIIIDVSETNFEAGQPANLWEKVRHNPKTHPKNYYWADSRDSK